MAKYIHNATFMVEKHEEDNLLQWLKPIAEAQYDNHDVMGGRISVLVEAGGSATADDEAQSIAFQLEFDSLQSLKEWESKVLPGIADEFEKKYTGRGLLFCSVFREI